MVHPWICSLISVVEDRRQHERESVQSLHTDLLKFGSYAKQSQLSTQLLLQYNTGEFDDVDFTNADNTNGLVRLSYKELKGSILHDLLQVKRYIFKQVGIVIKFHRSKSDFCLLKDEAKQYKFDMAEMILRVWARWASRLGSTNAKYPYPQGNGVSDFVQKNVELLVESSVS